MKFQKNFSTAPQRHSATAPQRNSAGYSFAQISFLLSLPDNPQQLPGLARRCPGCDNDCTEFWWGERPREPHCPGTKISHPDFVNACPDRDHRCPDFQTGCPGLVSRCPGGFRLCPDFQPPAPFLRAIAPISKTPRRFCNLLPQRHLRYNVGQASRLPANGKAIGGKPLERTIARADALADRRDACPTLSAALNLQPSTLN